MSNARHSTADLISIVDLTNPHSQILAELFAQGLTFLRAAQQARRVALTREGDLHDLGPDYQVRTAARALLVKVAVVGKIPLVEEPAQKGMYLDELRRYIKEAVVRGTLPKDFVWSH